MYTCMSLQIKKSVLFLLNNLLLGNKVAVYHCVYIVISEGSTRGNYKGVNMVKNQLFVFGIWIFSILVTCLSELYSGKISDNIRVTRFGVRIQYKYTFLSAQINLKYYSPIFAPSLDETGCCL